MFIRCLTLFTSLVILGRILGQTQFCATINPKNSLGATGYYALQIVNGAAQHQFKLDLTNFNSANLPSGCDLSGGLMYHMHTYDVSSNPSVPSGATSQCGTATTGTQNHYDPAFACSSASQYINNKCVSLGRVSTSGYTYSCSPSSFSGGNYIGCEVGDISGKFGIVMASSNTSLIFTKGILSDYYPPLIDNFNASLPNSLGWGSAVFHCANNKARLVCATFSAASLSSCSGSFTAMATVSTVSSVFSGVSQSTFNTAVVVSVLICLFSGIAIGAAAMHWGGKKAPPTPMSKNEEVA